VVLSIFDENKGTSFLIQGMNFDCESLDKTKRYRIYKGLIARLVSDKYFHHVFIDKKSIYLLINKIHDRIKYFQLIKEMFESEYQGEILE
jgi:hypothetical protein